jgi:hypothetical protein
MGYISAVSSQIVELGSIVVRSLAKKVLGLWITPREERIPLDRIPMRAG